MSRAAELAKDVLARARAAGVMVVTAESCTGGLVAAALTDLAGASSVVDRGFVTYTNAAKQQMLGVKPETLAAHGAVSGETAAEMANGALAASDAALAVSITGIAGPSGGSAEKPVGTVWFGLAQAGRPTLTRREQFGEIGRDAVRRKSVETALTLLRDALD